MVMHDLLRSGSEIVHFGIFQEDKYHLWIWEVICNKYLFGLPPVSDPESLKLLEFPK